MVIYMYVFFTYDYWLNERKTKAKAMIYQLAEIQLSILLQNYEIIK